MATIMTVRGPISEEQLGYTLMHEHLLTASAGLGPHFPDLMSAGRFKMRIATALRVAKAAGIDTILDASTPDLGRNPGLLLEMSQESGMNIIATTGWWLDVPRSLADISVDKLAELFLREVEEGIDGTTVRPGVLKAASDEPGVTPSQEIVLRAVARAHLRSGLPIIVHSFPRGRVGEQQAAILEEEGVEPHRVCLGHSNDTLDVDYLTGLARRNYFLGMDRYPSWQPPPRERTETLKKLIDAGFASQLLPSHDWPELGGLSGRTADEEELKRYNPHGWLYFNNVVIPWLLEMGVEEAIAKGLCVESPRRFLAGS